MKWFLLALLLLLPQPLDAQGLKETKGLKDGYDLWGHKYPVECLGDLKEVNIPVFIVPPQKMRPGYIGECIDCSTPYARIDIDERVKNWKNGPMWRDEAIRHEKCHRKMFLIGKSVYWHEG